MANAIRFLESVHNGIYFDRCIDLTFYDENMNAKRYLKTPEVGYKPDITIKGTLIEGSYSISSFISITNLSYEFDINSIYYIKARMYYRGLIGKTVGNLENYQGHVILFSVLYADQEKEPPNRAVRFQCTVSATDYTRLGTKLYTDGDGVFTLDEKPSNANNNEQNKSVGRKLKDVLMEVCKMYNQSLPLRLKTGDTDLQIYKLIFDCKKHEDIDIDVGMNFSGSIGAYLSFVNNKTVTINSIMYNVFKVYINQNTMNVSIVYPKDSSLLEEEYFKERTDDGGEYDIQNTVGITPANVRKGGSRDIALYYIKSAYRQETIINVTTLFDDRIYPGCNCKIVGSSIMGKSKTRSLTKDGSKITSYRNEMVTFRATGKIEYEFSTTNASSMNLQGPVVKDEYLEGK
jgi:hypothetical protein